MSTTTIETLTRMLAAYPPAVQTKAIEHLREYLADITDDLRWDESFERGSDKLIETARRVKEQAINGESQAFDLDKL